MIQRAAHIILAVLVFFSSAGFVLNKHFCQGELKSVALFSKATSCHAGKTLISCPVHGQMEMPTSKEPKGCCNDIADYVKSDIDQMVSQYSLDLESQVFLPAIAIFSALPSSISVDRQTIHYLNYKPPLIICDLSVELQTFRC